MLFGVQIPDHDFAIVGNGCIVACTRLRGLREIVIGKLSKRGVDLRNVDQQEPAISSIGHARQELKIQQGLEGNKAKEIILAIKSAGFKKRVRVQICRDRYRDLKGYFLQIAAYRSGEELGSEFFDIPVQPYGPIRRQLLNLVRLVNAKRQEVGLPKVPPSVLRYRRLIVKPFESLKLRTVA
jgi:hypothetical protein